MDILIGIFVGMYGLVLGSFYNVVGLRVPQKESIVSPPSHCSNCHQSLKWRDLVPVFSYLFLRGRCRYCQHPISFRYPLMECLTGVLFFYAYVHFGWSGEFFLALVFISLLVMITVSDLAYMVIPDRILLPFGIGLGVMRLFFPLDPWWDMFSGAAIGFGLLLLIAVLSKGGMGGGDIKLFLVIGLVLGTVQTLLTLFLSACVGSIVGLLYVRKSKKGRRTPIPFGPFIALAAVCVFFFGKDLVSWYILLFK